MYPIYSCPRFSASTYTFLHTLQASASLNGPLHIKDRRLRTNGALHIVSIYSCTNSGTRSIYDLLFELALVTGRSSRGPEMDSEPVAVPDSIRHQGLGGITLQPEVAEASTESKSAIVSYHARLLPALPSHDDAHQLDIPLPPLNSTVLPNPSPRASVPWASIVLSYARRAFGFSTGSLRVPFLVFLSQWAWLWLVLQGCLRIRPR